MSETASISTGIADRYATALFDLTKEEGQLDTLERDTSALGEALAESADLTDMIRSPVYSREEQGKAIAAVAGAIGLGGYTTNMLKLMATKRRLFVLPDLVRILKQMIADEKGEVTVEVTSAHALSDDQKSRLADALAKSAGKTVKLSTSVDGDLIGGLVVRMGSQMVDTSIKTRLAALQNTMKEVR